MLRLLGLSRLLILIGIVTIVAAATALLVVGAVDTYELIAHLVAPGGVEVSKDKLMLESIELVDLILLATVLYVVAIGLYELFIDSSIPMPAWLRIHDIDDLKNKLTGVVITVLGVVFLGQVISWEGEANLLPFGVAIAAMVVALSYFLTIHSSKGKPANDDGESHSS